MTRRTLLVSILLIAWMWVGGTLRETSFAQKQSVPRPPDTAALVRERMIDLLAMMDTDKNGKISKQEWMKFMEAEFDRLDTKKTGELDPKELLKSTAKHVRSSDLGK